MQERIEPKIPAMSLEAYKLLEEACDKPAEWDQLTPRMQQVYVVRTSRDPWLTVSETAKAMGLTPSGISQCWKQLRYRCSVQPLDRGAPREQPSQAVLPSGRVATETLLRTIEPALHDIVKEMRDRGKIRKATLQQLAVSAGKLTDIRQVLSGEPTQIIAHEQRGNLLDLVGLLMTDMKRRGLSAHMDQRTGEIRFERNVTPKVEASS